jgi:hypothetical protein
MLQSAARCDVTIESHLISVSVEWKYVVGLIGHEGANEYPIEHLAIAAGLVDR